MAASDAGSADSKVAPLWGGAITACISSSLVDVS
jgi:hypothetical protein